MTKVGVSVYRRILRDRDGKAIIGRDGKPLRVKRYTIELRLPDGTVRRKIAFADKAASEQLAARMLLEVERKEVGLHDPFAQARRQPLDTHAAAFLSAMAGGTLRGRRRARIPEKDSVERTKRRLAWMLPQMGATRIEHLTFEKAEQLLFDRLQAGWSAKTRDDHAALLRQFGNWLVDSKRAASNPFHHLRSVRDGASKTFRRHALTLHELEKLVEAAEVRPLQEGLKANPWMGEERREQLQAAGVERGVLYQVAAYTGLRRDELLSLVWGDLRFGDHPAIEVRGETTKGKRDARLELPKWLAKLLEQVRVARAVDGKVPAGTEAVFTASYRHITERLRRDALFARIGVLRTVAGKRRVVAPDGRVIDLHALRGTLATTAAEIGVAPKMLQEIMRHRDIRLTMEVYAQVRNAAVRDAVESLPQPRPCRRP